MNPFQRWRMKRQLDAETRILSALDSATWSYGYDLCKETRMRPGRMYPALSRLEQVGTVEADWDDRPEHRRRMYRRTEVAT